MGVMRIGGNSRFQVPPGRVGLRSGTKADGPELFGKETEKRRLIIMKKKKPLAI